MKIRFSKNERVGIITLSVLILSQFIFSVFYSGSGGGQYDFSEFEEKIEAFESEQRRLADSAEAAYEARRQNFRKGNGYWQRDSVKENGMHFSQDTSKRVKPKYYDIVKMDLNSCDTNDLMTVPQFGSKRAAKLVEYREKLGGFNDFGQVKEVFVLQNIEISHLEKYFYIDKSKIRKLHINTITYKELISHPYFDSYLTKRILNYRGKNKRINSLEEIRQCTNAYPELMEQITPYVSFD